MRPLILLAFAVAAGAQTHENLNAVVWMQTAAEYRAAARQSYRAAELSLERALADPRWTAALEQSTTEAYQKLPPAVILDLDETVLDNSLFQARLTASGTAYSEAAWRRWVSEGKAGVVPGAREFLALAHGRGVAAFYVSNRTCDPSKDDDPTIRVLRSHALPFAPERVLCRTDSGDKSARRKQIAVAARVLMIIGDDLNDFVSTPFDVAVRSDLVADYGRYWGERWFLVPNPAYGSWERSVGSTVDAKRKALRQ